MTAAGDDDIDQRLRAADPAPPGLGHLPSGRRLEDLVEQIMTTTETEQARTDDRTPRRWPAAAAAVATLVAGAGIYVAVSNGGHSAKHTPTVVSLKVAAPTQPHPGRPGGTTCIRFSVDLLAQQQLAFSGTVTSASDQGAKLTVDHWYKGGSADEVDVATAGTPGGPNELGVQFTTGKRYLVSATGGTVTGCGYTGEYSSELASDFAQAFH